MMTVVPGWIETLTERVLALVTPYDQLPAAGCHFAAVDGVWEVTLFIGSTEMIGGLGDGTKIDSPFALDLLSLTECFDEIHRLGWQSLPLGETDDLGSHISAEGLVSGEQVWLRITARAPEEFGPARQSIVYDRSFGEIW